MKLPVKQAMADLLNAVDVEMRHDTNSQFLAPGAEVAWDDCCSDDGDGGGQLWVRVVNINPSLPFPRTDNEQKCGVTFVAATLGVGTVRCAHTLDDQGNPPTGDQMTGDTNRLMDDMEDIFSGIVDNYEWHHKVGAYQPVGPDGGCAGGEWLVTVRVKPCQ